LRFHEEKVSRVDKRRPMGVLVKDVVVDLDTEKETILTPEDVLHRSAIK
jgi:hypothetical protein